MLLDGCEKYIFINQMIYTVYQEKKMHWAMGRFPMDLTLSLAWRILLLMSLIAWHLHQWFGMVWMFCETEKGHDLAFFAFFTSSWWAFFASSFAFSSGSSSFAVLDLRLLSLFFLLGFLFFLPFFEAAWKLLLSSWDLDEHRQNQLN